jgi:hypothetical protein
MGLEMGGAAGEESDAAVLIYGVNISSLTKYSTKC